MEGRDAPPAPGEWGSQRRVEKRFVTMAVSAADAGLGGCLPGVRREGHTFVQHSSGVQGTSKALCSL